MSLDTVNAVIEGYQDRLFDQQILHVQGGFWAGYYMGAKRPKPLKKIITDMLTSRNKNNKKKHSDAVDVDAYLEMEASFQYRKKLLEGSEVNGR